MKKVKNEELNEVLDFLKNDIVNCLYMYIDIKKYGADNPNIKVWIEENELGKIIAVVMEYYGSIQVASVDDDWHNHWLINLINTQRYNMISGKAALIDKLKEMLQDEYHFEYGQIYQLSHYRKVDDVEIVEYADASDMKEIAELICMDEAFKVNYQVEILEKQLRERLESGMGRNAIIREKNKIVAHIATYAEFEDIAITSGLIVCPEYRNSSYGFIVESVITNDLLQEGKKIYTFVLDKKRRRFLNVLVGKACGDYGKLTRKR